MIETVGIIGAGTMGNGIAQICAAAGLQVVMVDISDAAVSRGVATIGGSLDRLVKKEKMSAADRDAVLLNSAAALVVADKVSNLRDGVALAAESIKTLERNIFSAGRCCTASGFWRKSHLHVQW